MPENNVNIHEGHRERMRERFLATGFEGFSEHQIIEMLLFYTCPRRDTNALAHMLIERFGSLAGIFDADVRELCEVSGMGENAAVLFKMIPQTLNVYYASHAQKEVIDNTEKMKKLFMSCYVGKNVEEFRIACFDNNLHVICNKVICTGSPSCAPVDMRKIAEIILESKSSAVAISHNHPNGSPAPSTNDICATRVINSLVRSLGISLLDHIVVGAGSSVSMRDAALINVFD